MSKKSVMNKGSKTTRSAKTNTKQRANEFITQGSARWVVAVSILVVIMLGFVLVRASLGAAGAHGAPNAQATPTLSGTSMQFHPAPAFSLTDQNGATISLASLRGKVVVLTFLDATCTQQCPLMIEWLNWATTFMSPQQIAQVAWVAISVNPNNTAALATAFLQKNKAAMNMRFLLGTQAQLKPLWKAYYIAVIPAPTDVAHTSGLYVIDQQGRERSWHDAGFDPRALATDLKQLLAA